MVRIGIIGGSGLDNPDLLKEPEEVTLDTPYGAPSSPLKRGLISGREVVLLARHGIGHTIPPTQVNFRANVWALKEIGCSHILVTTAVGSLREEIGPGILWRWISLLILPGGGRTRFMNDSSPGPPYTLLRPNHFQGDCEIVVLRRRGI